MKVSLLTLGVGLVIATAAYMMWLAAATRDAAAATSEFNEEQEKSQRRSLTRAGEQAFLRRGAE
jgi:threonine/homoserine/homoserine lactone efflux protein